MRNYRMLIAESELLASPPERVFSWLEARAESGSRLEVADEELEQALLERREPLIDIGLARFCRNKRIAKQLVSRTADNAREVSHNRALRLAVLSNQPLARESIFGFPGHAIFDGDDGLLAAWLASADNHEIAALFQNPRVDDRSLRDFLECKGPWHAMSEEQRLVAVYALSESPRITQLYEGPMDGGAESSHASVFNAAWKLAEIVPTSRVWARALTSLYERLQREAFSMKNPLATAERWQLDPSEVEALKREKSDNRIGFLGDHQGVRRGLARLALTERTAIGSELLTSADVALRAAAYSEIALSRDEIMAAYERDKRIALEYLRENERIWRSPEARNSLNEICWQAAKDDENSDLMPVTLFKSVKARMARAHPEWFDHES